MLKKRLHLVFALSMISVICAPNNLGQNPPAEGTSTGQKIGAIVKAAVETAFPAAKTIVDLIWGARGTNNDKIRKDELNAAVEKAKEELKKQFTIEAQKKIQPVSQVADEIFLVNRFLEPSVIANLTTVRMQTSLSRLTTGGTNDGPIWTSLETDWKITKAHLDKVKNITDDDLKKVRDFWLRDKLKKIKDLNSDLVIRVDAAIGQKNATEAKELLGKLSETLQDITVAVGYELSDLQGDIKNLADWSKGAAGAAGDLTPQQKAFKSLLDQKFPQ